MGWLVPESLRSAGPFCDCTDAVTDDLMGHDANELYDVGSRLQRPEVMTKSDYLVLVSRSGVFVRKRPLGYCDFEKIATAKPL
jgi:hypothetical protein